MPKETKSGNVKIEFSLSEKLKSRFHKKCKKANVSMAQQARDLIQQYLKQ